MKDRIPGLHRQRHKGHDLWRAYARMRQRGKGHHLCQHKLGTRNRHHHRREGIHGKIWISGEFGHVNVFDNEILCHCGKKDAWKRKPQDRHYTASCWKESVAEKVPYYQNGLQKIRPPWMKSSPQSIKRTCYALR